MNHPISDLFKLSSASMKELSNVDTVVGKPVMMENDICIIPISKVKCSFATGGTETHQTKSDGEYPFGGATGGVVSISPVAFLVVHDEKVELLHLEDQTHLLEKVIDEVPEVMNQMKELFSKKTKVSEVERIEKKIQL